MDKAYLDFQALNRIGDEEAFFSTRAKDNLKYTVISENFNIDKILGLQRDCSIRLTGYKSSKLYLKELRLIKHSNTYSGELLYFVTNIIIHQGINGLKIANIYQHR